MVSYIPAQLDLDMLWLLLIVFMLNQNSCQNSWT